MLEPTPYVRLVGQVGLRLGGFDQFAWRTDVRDTQLAVVVAGGRQNVREFWRCKCDGNVRAWRRANDLSLVRDKAGGNVQRDHQRPIFIGIESEHERRDLLVDTFKRTIEASAEQ